MSSWRCYGRGYARLTWGKMHSGGSAGSSAGSHFPCHARRLSWTSAPQEQVRSHVLFARDSWGWGQGEGDRVFQVIYTCSGFSLHNCERSVLRWPVSLPRVPSRRSTPSLVPWVIRVQSSAIYWPRWSPSSNSEPSPLSARGDLYPSFPPVSGDSRGPPPKCTKPWWRISSSNCDWSWMPWPTVGRLTE